MDLMLFKYYYDALTSRGSIPFMKPYACAPVSVASRAPPGS